MIARPLLAVAFQTPASLNAAGKFLRSSSSAAAAALLGAGAAWVAAGAASLGVLVAAQQTPARHQPRATLELPDEGLSMQIPVTELEPGLIRVDDIPLFTETVGDRLPRRPFARGRRGPGAAAVRRPSDCAGLPLGARLGGTAEHRRAA